MLIKEKRMKRLQNGFNWVKKNKIYSIVDMKDGMVTYVVNNPSKSTKIKTKPVEKVLKMIENSQVQSEAPKKNINARGVLITSDSLILRDLPLEKPLSDGTETVYCFSVNSKGEFLIGTSRHATEPVWVKSQDLIDLVDKAFLNSIAKGDFKIDLEKSDEDLKKDILKEIQKLKNK